MRKKIFFLFLSLLIIISCTIISYAIDLVPVGGNVTIHFYDDGNKMNGYSIYSKIGETVSLPTPDKNGYDFICWLIDGNQYNGGENFILPTVPSSSESGYTYKATAVWELSLYGKCGDELSYLFDEDTGTLRIIGTGKMDSFHLSSVPWEPIKEKIKNVEITSATSIGNYAFADCQNLNEIELGTCLKEIGDYAFQNCQNIYGKLNLPESLIDIGDYAFYNCRGFSGRLILPENLEYIGERAFYFCNGFSGKLVLPQKLTEISNGCFQQCHSFTGFLEIPSKVTIIGDYAFSGCWGLNSKLVLHDNITYIGEAAFSSCRNLSGELILPKNLESLGSSAFRSCDKLIGDIRIPDKITNIGENTFSYSGFDGKLYLPAGLLSIGDYAFDSCNKLKGTLSLPESLQYIGERAFSHCSNLTGDLVLPNKVSYIGSSAFEGCVGFHGTLKLPTNIQNISEGTFSGCNNLTGQLIIPDSVFNIGSYAFHECCHFSGDLVIPINVSSIGDYAFYEFGSMGNGGNAILSEGIETIGEYAFIRAFSNIKPATVSIPSTVYFIGNESFSGASILSFVVSLENPDYCSLDGVLFDKNKEILIQFPKYKDGTEYIVPETVTTIGAGSFAESGNLNGSLLLSCKVKRIEDRAFENCVDFVGKLIIPETVISIGNASFYSTNYDSFIPNIYFYGDAPSITGIENDGMLRGGMPTYSFNEETSLSFIPGKEGWDFPMWKGYRTYYISDGIKIQKLDLNMPETIAVGETIKVFENIEPYYAENTNLIWSVTGNASITDDGILTANGPGTITVTAKTKDGSNLSASKSLQAVTSDQNRIIIGSATGIRGGEIIIPVSIKTLEKVSSFQFTVYIGSGLWFQDIIPVEQSTIDLNNLSFWDNYDYDSGLRTLTFVYDSNKPIDASGVLFNLDLYIEPESNNDWTWIGLEPFNDYTFMFLDNSGNTLDFNWYESFITIHESEKGDANCDGKINVLDVHYLRDIAARNIEKTSIMFETCDFNDDGKVNVLDVNILRRYLTKITETLDE